MTPAGRLPQRGGEPPRAFAPSGSDLLRLRREGLKTLPPDQREGPLGKPVQGDTLAKRVQGGILTVDILGANLDCDAAVY